MYRTLLSITSTCLLAGNLFAESRSIDADSLIQFALENHLYLQVAESDTEAARQQTLQAGTLPDPEVSWGYFLERMDSRQTLSVRQGFPWPGTLSSQRETSRLRGEAAEAIYELRRLEIARSVRDAYWQWSFAFEELKLLRRHAALVQPMIEVVESRVANDRARTSELLRMELLLDRLEDSIDSQTASIDVAASRLKRAMGLPVDSPFDLRPGRSLWDEIGKKEVSGELPLGHPLFQSFLYGERAAEEAERSTRYGNRPGWMLGAEWMDNAGPARDEVMVMVSFNLPVWRERNTAAVAESRARTRSARAQRADAEAEWHDQWNRSFREYEDARRKVDRFQNRLIPRAEDALEAEIEAYRSGRGDLVSLLETQRLLLDLEREALGARLDLQLTVVSLRYLRGETATKSSTPTPSF